MHHRFPSNIAALLIISMTCAPVIAQLQPGFLQFPQHSVATVEGALSPVVNPAGLGIYNGESLLIMAPYLKKADFGDWGFALGGEDIGFITEVIRNNVNGNRVRYTWGLVLDIEFSPSELLIVIQAELTDRTTGISESWRDRSSSCLWAR